MKSNRSQTHGGGAKSLRFEQLEERSLLAVAAFQVNLYEDVGGAPGALIADDAVEVGDTFFAEITVREFHPLFSGLRRVALDIAWDPDVLEEIDAPFNPGELVTADLPRLLTGTLDNEAGEIEDLGGSASVASNTGRPIGNLSTERFALLHFRAEQPAEASLFSMNQGGSRIVTVPVSSLSSAQLDFEAQTITVLAASDPAGSGSSIATQVDTPASEEAGTADSGAVLALDVNLYEDAGGVPGGSIANDTLEVGQSFFVEVTVEDLRDAPQGIGGLSLDVAWDPAIFTEIDQPFDPALDGSDLVTGDLPLYRTGSLDNEAGEILDLGGAAFRSSGSGEPIGADGPERFSLLHFRAVAATEGSPISLEIGASGVGIVQGTIEGPGDLAIETPSIAVAEPAEPPRIEIAGGSGPDLTTVQFTTELGGSGPDASTSPLVRPALPDTKQYVEVVNTGPSSLTIHQVLINVPDVAVDVPLSSDPADDLVLAPGGTQQFHLTYAPTTPARRGTSAQSFRASDGLVILSNAENAPRLEIALMGESTYNADVTYDGRVNIADLVRFDDCYGLAEGEPGYEPTADPSGDGRIDLGDFGWLNVAYGASRPEPEAALPISPARAAATDTVLTEALSGDTAPAPASDVSDSWLAAVAADLLSEDGVDDRAPPTFAGVDQALLYTDL